MAVFFPFKMLKYGIAGVLCNENPKIRYGEGFNLFKMLK